ncbi:MAG: M28 family metallopeptidase [Longimicrobiales bacterium]
MFALALRRIVSSALPLLALAWAGCAPSAPVPTVQALVDSVSEEQYQSYQLALENMGLGLYGGADYNMGYRNRDTREGLDSPGNQEARLYLRDAFSAMGLDVSIQGPHRNVVGEMTGTTTPGRIYIIGGHYDHLEGDLPGGDDNASGTAGVLEAARVLSQYRFESTIRFIGFNAEEDGLAGSKDYVENHVIPAGENVVGMINLDMILRPGSDVDPDNVIDVEVEARYAHEPSVAWARAFQQAADDFVPSLVVNDTVIDTESTSDNDSFRDAGFPAILVIENSLPDFWEANKYYHTYEDASDRLANDPNSPSGVTYGYAFAADVVRAVVGLVAGEAVLIPERGRRSF